MAKENNQPSLNILHNHYKGMLNRVANELIQHADKLGKNCSVDINIRYWNKEE